MRTALAIFAVMALVLSHCWQGASAAQTDVGGEAKDSGGVLDGVDVNALCLMSLGEAIDILGSNHTEPHRSLYGECITYEGSCQIAYFNKGIRTDEDGILAPRLELEEDIDNITVYQKLDIYKGISVGKTIDEINRNPDLRNRLEVSINEEDHRLSAQGYYEHQNTLMIMVLFFNEDMICTEISLDDMAPLV